MDRTPARAYWGGIHTIHFKRDYTNLEISVDKSIPIRPGKVLIVEMPGDETTRRKLLQAIAEATGQDQKERQPVKYKYARINDERLECRCIDCGSTEHLHLYDSFYLCAKCVDRACDDIGREVERKLGGR